MAEIDVPEPQRKVLGGCVDVVLADRYLADSEPMVLQAAVQQWGLRQEVLQAGAPHG